MKITNIQVDNYGSTPSGRVQLMQDGTSISFPLASEESHALFALAQEMFLRRQEALARHVAELRPMVLAGPSCVDAEYSDAS